MCQVRKRVAVPSLRAREALYSQVSNKSRETGFPVRQSWLIGTRGWEGLVWLRLTVCPNSSVFHRMRSRNLRLWVSAVM